MTKNAHLKLENNVPRCLCGAIKSPPKILLSYPTVGQFLRLCDCHKVTTGDHFLGFKQLNEQIYSCRRCRLWQGAKQAVPGEGPTNSQVMIVGQNPGAEEDEAGKPFVGKAGKYLIRVLEENGLKREDLFITNVVKHKTPKNRKPYIDEVKACLPYLLEQIDEVKPKKVLLFGAVARGIPRAEGVEYFEIIHPAAVLRFPKNAKLFQAQLQQALDKTGT
jgi:DNA polymerase